jgi:RNA 3'-terminal phosphate cyclase (GTP)
MIELDGSYLEGGGQIVRTALALSAITEKSFEITNIRKGRKKPGLKNQHLFCIKALEELCNAKTGHAELGSEKLRFLPGKIKPKTLSIDIGTAGSISLLLQSLFIPTIFAKSKIKIKITGGTDVSWSPQFDYLQQVIIPQLKKYADIETSLLKRGYYPKGGGTVEIKIKPKFNLENLEEIPKINLTEQHNIILVKGISHASSDLQEANVAERQAKTAKFILSKLNCPIQIRTEYCQTLSTGSGITLWVIFSKDPEEIDALHPIRIGVDILGERGKRSEDIGKQAADKLLKEIESKAPVDQNLADNLIPFLALIGGKIKTSKITNHTLTNIYVCEQFLDTKFKVDKENGTIEAKLYK